MRLTDDQMNALFSVCAIEACAVRDYGSDAFCGATSLEVAIDIGRGAAGSHRVARVLVQLVFLGLLKRDLGESETPYFYTPTDAGRSWYRSQLDETRRAAFGGRPPIPART